jgi:hypothetical protein
MFDGKTRVVFVLVSLGVTQTCFNNTRINCVETVCNNDLRNGQNVEKVINICRYEYPNLSSSFSQLPTQCEILSISQTYMPALPVMRIAL